MQIEEKLKKVIELQVEIKHIADSIKNIMPCTPDITDLKRQRKELTKEIRKLEEETEEELNEDNEIREFRGKKVIREEQLAEAIDILFDELKKCQNGFVMHVDSKVVQGTTLQHLFVNGKELKSRAFQQKLF